MSNDNDAATAATNDTIGPRFVAGTDVDGDPAVLDKETGEVYGFVLVDDISEVADAWNAAGEPVSRAGVPIGELLTANVTDEFTPLGAS